MRTHRARALPIAVALALLALAAGPAAAAETGGTISGTVVAPDGGAVPGDACVSVLSGSDHGYVTGTRATPRFEVRVPAGLYVVRAAACDPQRDEVATYYDANDFFDKRVVQVVSGEARTGTDIRLAAGSSISGHVTGDGGAPLAGVCVAADLPYATGTAHGSFDGPDVPTTRTRPDGSFTLHAVAVGRWILEASPCDGSAPGYRGELFDDVEDPFDASPIDISADRPATGLEIALGHGASASGMVTDGDGRPITSGDICLSTQEEGTDGLSARTDAAGRYAFDHLPEGTYRLRAFDCAGSSRNDVPRHVGADPAGPDVATPVRLAHDEQRDGLDVQLPTGTSVSGHVSAAGTDGDRPLADACVGLLPAAGEHPTQTTQTDADGAYRFDHLLPAAGGLRVRFAPCGLGEVIERSYGGTFDPASGAVLHPTPAAPAVGIDGRLDRASSIVGTVRDAAGLPVGTQDICVDATRRDVAFVSRRRVVGADGTYRIDGLPAGTYDLNESDCLGDRHDRADPVPGVVVRDAEEVPAPDVVLRSAAQVTGHVYGGAGDSRPLRSACASARPRGGGPVADTTSTHRDGSYALDHLEPGVAYVVTITDCSGASSWRTETRDAGAVAVAAPVVLDAHLTSAVPPTRILSGPVDGGFTLEERETVQFANPDPDVTTTCALDHGEEVPCSSPWSFTVRRPRSLREDIEVDHLLVITTRLGAHRAPNTTTIHWTVDPDGTFRGRQAEVAPGGSATAPAPPGDAPATVELSASARVTTRFAMSTFRPGWDEYPIDPELRPFGTIHTVAGTPVDPETAGPAAHGRGAWTLTFHVRPGALPAGVDPERVTMLFADGWAPEPASLTCPAATDDRACVRRREIGADGSLTLTVESADRDGFVLLGVGPEEEPTTPPDTAPVPAPEGSLPTPVTPRQPATTTTTGPTTPIGPTAAAATVPVTTSAAPAAPVPVPTADTVPTTAAAPAVRAVSRIGRPSGARLPAALRSGVRVPMSCATRCAVRLELRVDARTARHAHLGSRRLVLRRGTFAPGAHVVRLVVPARIRRALAREGRLALSVVGAIDGAQATTRTLVLRR